MYVCMYVCVCVCVNVEPLMAELMKLRYEGVRLYDVSKKKWILVKCRLLLATADYRAVPDFCCNCQSPAYIGACIKCHIEGRKRKLNIDQILKNAKDLAKANVLPIGTECEGLWEGEWLPIIIRQYTERKNVFHYDVEWVSTEEKKVLTLLEKQHVRLPPPPKPKKTSKSSSSNQANDDEEEEEERVVEEEEEESLKVGDVAQLKYRKKWIDVSIENIKVDENGNKSYDVIWSDDGSRNGDHRYFDFRLLASKSKNNNKEKNNKRKSKFKSNKRAYKKAKNKDDVGNAEFGEASDADENEEEEEENDINIDVELENINVVTKSKGGVDATFYAHNVTYLDKTNVLRKWYEAYMGDRIEKVKIKDTSKCDKDGENYMIVNISHPRVPPPAVKTEETQEKVYENLRSATSAAEHKRAVKQGGYHQEHVFYDYKCLKIVLHVINDLMHEIYNLIKYIFGYMIQYHFKDFRKRSFMKENRFFTMADTKGKPPDDNTEWIDTNEYYKINARWPWQASKASILKLIDEAEYRRIPGDEAGKLNCPFQKTKLQNGTYKIGLRSMKSAEWLHLASPIGIYYITQTDLHPRYKLAFCNVIWFLYEIRTRHIRSTGMIKPRVNQSKPYDYKTYWQEIAVILEYLMPYNFNAIVVHIFQHTVDDLHRLGPVYGHWAYPFESGQGWLKNIYHSNKVVEESICRAIASEWRTMLHQYDDVEPSKYKSFIKKLIRPGLAGSYPTTVTVLTLSEKKLSFSNETNEYKYLHLYYLQKNPVLVIIQAYYEKNIKRWDDKDIRTYNWITNVHLNNINNKLKAADYLDNNQQLTKEELQQICCGPVVSDMKQVKNIQVNESEFCDVITDGEFKTTNSCFRYRQHIQDYLALHTRQEEKTYIWCYGKIKKMYQTTAYAKLNDKYKKINDLRTRDILIWVENYGVQNKENDDNGLVRVQKESQAAVHTNKASVTVNANDVDDVNLAFWKVTQTQTFVVNKNFARKDAKPSTYNV
jgi:hypothetical protein